MAGTATLEVEHRYFDWVEQVQNGQPRYLLAPRGQGVFIASWVTFNEVLTRLDESARLGEMAVVYGTPAELRGAVVQVRPATHIRIISGELFDDTVFDYGREGPS